MWINNDFTTRIVTCVSYQVYDNIPMPYLLSKLVIYCSDDGNCIASEMYEVFCFFGIFLRVHAFKNLYNVQSVIHNVYYYVLYQELMSRPKGGEGAYNLPISVW